MIEVKIELPDPPKGFEWVLEGTERPAYVTAEQARCRASWQVRRIVEKGRTDERTE